MKFSEQYNEIVLDENKMTDWFRTNSDKVLKKIKAPTKLIPLVKELVSQSKFKSTHLTYSTIQKVAHKMGFELDTTEVEHVLHMGEELLHMAHAVI